MAMRAGPGRIPLVVLLCAVTGASGAARAAPGLPPLRSYEPVGHPQHWAVAQDSRGVVYVGNGDGVLEFDGAAWRLYPLPGQVAARSLAVGGDDTVFVGAQGDLGYLELAADGERRFRSLRDEVPAGDREFGDVWKTHAAPEGVYFQSYERLFLWAGGRMRVWRPRSAFHFSFLVEGSLYLLERGRGLLRLDGGELVAVPGGERLAEDRVYVVLPYGDGRLLVGAREQGLLLFDGSGAEPFPTEVDERLRRARLYHGVALPDGSFALATLGGGVLVVDRQGRSRLVLDSAAGLRSDAVNYLHLDREGGLWLALHGSLARAEPLAPLRFVDRRSDLLGMVLAAQAHGERLWVGTSEGLQVLPSAGGERPAPAPGGPLPATFDLAVAGDEVLAATGEGVFALAAGPGRSPRPARRVAEGVSLALLPSRREAGRVWVGQTLGLRVLEHEAGGWRDLGLLPGVEADVRTLVEGPQGELWLGTDHQGVLRVDPPPAGAAEGAAPVVRRFGAAHGVPAGGVDVHSVGGRPIFSTAGGLLRFDLAADGFVGEQGLSAALGEGPWRILCVAEVEATAGRGPSLWVVARPVDLERGEEYHLRVLERRGDAWVASPEPLALRLRGAALIDLYSEGGVVWVGTRNGLVRLDPGSEPGAGGVAPAPLAVLARRLSAGGARLARRPDADLELPWGRNPLRLEVALPAFAEEARNEFRYQLEGLDRDWSPWTAERSKEYTNLREGRYRLRFQGRDAYGRTSAEQVVAVTVLPPWYRTLWAQLALALAAVVLLHLAHGARVRHLRRRGEELAAAVAARTEELRASEGKYRELFDNANDVIALVDAEGRLLSINRAGEEVTGRTREELLGRPLQELVAPSAREALARLLVPPAGETPPAELPLVAADGRERVLEVGRRAIYDGERYAGMEWVGRDVTERRALEEQLLESYKMEAVGRLAGGLAERLSGVLASIQGHAAPLLAAARDAEGRRRLGEIFRVAEQAAALTRQLLAFGRRQTLRPRPVSLNEVVRGVEGRLRRLLGPGIELALDCAPGLRQVLADPGPLAQAVLDLAAHACASMPYGGVLSITTAEVDPGEELGRVPLGLLPGRYALLRVSDTGPGLAGEDLQSLFEPFNAAAGERPAGLGLAGVHGVVKQSGGHVAVESVLGRGTTFKVLLPLAPVVHTRAA
jgi:PAS domain S-box-containing protein